MKELYTFQNKLYTSREEVNKAIHKKALEVGLVEGEDFYYENVMLPVEYTDVTVKTEVINFTSDTAIAKLL